LRDALAPRDISVGVLQLEKKNSTNVLFSRRRDERLAKRKANLA
jgi:hypothetical protein